MAISPAALAQLEALFPGRGDAVKRSLDNLDYTDCLWDAEPDKAPPPSPTEAQAEPLYQPEPAPEAPVDQHDLEGGDNGASE